MLRHLSIKDFAVVRATELEFGPGMTVVSGETGAGKSLIVDALGFLSGLRADSGAVRHGAGRAELSAEFGLADDGVVAAWLRDRELDDADDCQLRRVIRADGGSRAWINGRPVTLSQLADLATHLIEIHGQHAHQALLSRPSQLALLDAYARNQSERERVRKAAEHWQALEREREDLLQQGDVSDRIAYLEHQLAELEREDLTPAALETLNQNHLRQAHAAALIQACDTATARLNGDDAMSALQQLRQTRAALARLNQYEPGLNEVDALLDSAKIQLDEALSLLDRIRDGLDIDPAGLTELERRLARLHDLARKHRVAPEQLQERQQAAATELEGLRNAGSRLARLDSEQQSALDAWTGAAAMLTESRRRAAATLAEAVTASIVELGMGNGHFQIDFATREDGRPDPNGAERIEFLVSANAGQPPRPLRKVASGGELSRISLAIEVATLGMDTIPTMVFDEVDAGIGGAVAEIVGQKLRALGGRHQVLCVTHLPQVAAQGHQHYRVSKAPVEGMTQSSVELLDTRRREEEIARMLGGVEISKEARAAAKRLLRGT
ncbi:MAG: DNA repair protein RecN [Xanthomonadaceae bacterium]|jgi:DNA repair protein RecN (Recombination protein N)|nr:DNA repair protein RecN [Xanthomonadaceae bacterium]